MTIEELRIKCDNLLNEKSIGRYNSTEDVYDMMDTAQIVTVTAIIDMCRKKNNTAFINDSLAALVTFDPLSQTTTGSNLQEYPVPSDFTATVTAKYCSNGTHVMRQASYLPFETAYERMNNVYLSPYKDSSNNVVNPIYYVRQGKIGFFPQPTAGGANNYEHWYIKKPQKLKQVNYEGTTLVMSDNFYILFINYVLYLACIKDNRPAEATGYLNLFLNDINKYVGQ